MRKKLIILGILSILVVGVCSVDRLLSNSKKTTTQELSDKKAPEEAIQEKESSVELQQQDDKESEKISTAETQVAVQYQKAWSNFSYGEELKSYEQISRKVILSEKDKQDKAQLMSDERFLKSLEDILKAVPMDDKTRSMQNVALDFVVDSLKSNLNSVAVQFLKAIVQDPAVEDSKLPQAQRQALAGVKAEALFYLTSLDSKASSEVPALLPGTVSEKIWENIQKQQANNLAESQSLAGSK